MKSIKVKKGYIVQKLGKNTSIFNPEQSLLINLNSTGSYIFEQLKQGLSYSQILTIMNNKYDTNEENLQKDFDDFIKLLEKHDLIEYA